MSYSHTSGTFSSPIPKLVLRIESSSVIACVLAFLSTGIMCTFPGWHTEPDSDNSEREVKPFPSRGWSRAATALQASAFLASLVSMVWLHCAAVSYSVAVEQATLHAVKGRVGIIAMTLGWLGCMLVALVALGLLIMVLSISLLDRLTDEGTNQPMQDDGDE